MKNTDSDNSQEWAAQAYALLKKRQEEQKQELQKQEEQKQELQKQEEQKQELQKQEEQKQELQKQEEQKQGWTANDASNENLLGPPKIIDEPKLGDFDDNFTWSAMVLAAQGKKINQISIDEIDWLTKLRKGLEETRKGFVTELLDKLGDDPLTPESLDDLETLLIRADVGIDSTDKVISSLRTKLNEEVVGGEAGIKFLKKELKLIVDKPIKNSGTDLLIPQKGKLNVWLLVGVNGVGKTTTLGKLAYLSSRSNYKTLIAAADTFRAAAVEQLKVWGERSNVDVISNQSKNADPAAVVFDAINSAQKRNVDLLLVDTAGRLQTKNNLMDELAKIKKIIDKKVPDAIIESLLVLDASQGQNGLKQAKSFAKSANLSGAIITKLDGTSRGGVSLAVSEEVNLPIRFIGAGEGIKDLRPFNSYEFVEAMLADK
ncbi:signal recognition particle-docking protein FtsY [Prochlorococcus marinus str. MIT 9312]|uniref:Signal recognition particle receptor FtsY n=1 Tax=Prochlorococcus marinus (strain MIT 9312) TaxID=74546 RepID=Q31DH4_PROM9|nr:signal recognition particle-docking protein FtsY [Prochlorococcus marinus]ABB49071.1 signal recognition particle-docking protein FtsY [Prochlorococcus marinus str. MIT 9312]KGF99692.1 Signal recognition particle receptor protein FtsY (alpha subunit) [Prochlorococcus marinus str. MIT 9311]